MRTNTDISGKLTTFSGTLTLGNGTQLALTDSDLVSQSLSIKNAVGNSGELTVGGVVIGALSFGLMNDNDRFTNIDWYDAKITVSLTVESTTLNMGEFLVVSHKESGRTVSIEAYDRLKLCDEYGIHEDNITYPTTASAIVGAICTARGMTYTGMRYPNMQIPDPEDDTMTEREVLSYIAQMMGQFAIVKNNVLTFGWYSSTPYNAGTTFGHDFQTSDKVIGGVEVKVSDDVKVTIGSGELVKIENNPFINEDNINTIASQINSVVSGMQYRVGSCAIVSSPAYECGDVFNVFTGRETVKVLVSNITYKKNYVQESIESYGTEVNDLRLSKTDRIKKLADKAISDQLKNPNSPLSKAIDDAGGGGDSKWGGPNNTYGIAEAYDNSDNKILQIDKDGVVMTDTNEMETLVKKEVTYKPKSIQNYNLPERIRSNATMGRVTKDIYDIMSHYIVGAITRTQFGPAFPDESVATPTNVPSGSASNTNANNKNLSAAYIETNRDRPTDRSYDKVDIKLGRKESTVEHGKSNVRFYGNVVSDNLLISHDSSNPTVEDSDFDNTYVSLISFGDEYSAHAIWLDYLEDDLKLVIGELQDNGKYKPIGYIDITPYSYSEE